MPLLGPDGKPIEARRLREEHATPTVGGVRQIYGAHPSANLDPRRLAAILRQAIEGDPIAYLELAEDMEEKDLHYLGVLSTRKRQVAQLEITVDPGGEDQRALDLAAEVEDWLTRDSLIEELVDLLDAIGKGFSVSEIVWETSARDWRPQALLWRDPRWFRFSRDDGHTLLLRSDTAPEGEPIVACKFVTHVHKAKSGLPIRGGLARAVAWYWMFRSFDVKSWVAFAEAFGQPLRVGKYGAGATPDDKRVLLRAVSEIARDAAAIIPDSMMIEFVEAKLSGSLELYEKLADWIDRQVSKAVLGQTTTTDAISGGHAVSKEHNEVRADIERADARQVAATLNRDLVRPLIALNFGPQNVYPRIRIGRPEEVDAAKVVEAVAKLVPLGFRVGQTPLRALLALPAPDEGDEELRAPAAPAVSISEAANVAEKIDPADKAADPADAPAAEDAAGDEDPEEAPAGKKMASRPAPAAEDDPVEQLLAKLAGSGDLADAMQPLTGPLAKLAAEAGDYQTFLARLAEHLASADVSRMADLLARTMFFGAVAGRVGAEIEKQ